MSGLGVPHFLRKSIYGLDTGDPDMMTVTEFQALVDETPDPPSDLDPYLKALWWGRRGAWEASHDQVNELDTAIGSWVHAWLHRVEGDLSNAAYWYRLAGRAVAEGDLEEEWRELVEAALSEPVQGSPSGSDA